MLAHDLVALGTNDVMVAGGMESMSNAPYLLPKARAGLRLGHGEVKDHMFLDGLEDAYDPGRLMGTFAEDCAFVQRLIDENAGNIFFYTDNGLTAGAAYGPSQRVVIGSTGVVTLNNLGSAGSASLCRNASNQISSCSSSSRYKTNLAPFGSGMDLVRHLRGDCMCVGRPGEAAVRERSA